MIYLILLTFVVIIAGLTAAIIFAFDKLKTARAHEAQMATSWNELQAKYKDVLDLEAFKQNLSNEIATLHKLTADERSLIDTLSTQAEGIKRQLEIYNGEQTVVDCGLYTPVYDFNISQKYKDALEDVREKQKTSLKSDTAATCSQTWTVNGDKRAGLKQTKDYTRLMLRAFNGESDAIVSNVRWNNVDRMIERLEGVYQAINKLGETHTIKIERDYFALKLKELRLSYEYEEKLKAEKDAQRKMQEEIREEERVKKENERKIKESEDNENRSRVALEQARQQAQLAQNAEEKTRLNSKVQELEAKVAELSAITERTKSNAEMTKAGNVYVISNIGSFGENRFKIGMTRRDDPYDRVHELGDASVPFEFDVHAMIRSDNAPQLESNLHDRFSSKRVNLVNQRKEFFDVSLDEIAAVVKEYNSIIEFIKVPEAKSYRQSLLIRAQQVNSSPNVAQQQSTKEPERIASQAPAQQYKVYLNNNGTQEGPYPFEKINDMLASGQINAATLLWYEGLAGWIPVSQLQSQTSSSL